LLFFVAINSFHLSPLYFSLSLDSQGFETLSAQILPLSAQILPPFRPLNRVYPLPDKGLNLTSINSFHLAPTFPPCSKPVLFLLKTIHFSAQCVPLFRTNHSTLNRYLFETID